MELIQHKRNIHEVKIKSNEFRIAVLSDIHFDNPKCDRELLKRHLDWCLENNIPVFINGDFFCLMQGKYDPRRNKKDILPQHNAHNYIDLVIEEAVEWWKPYAELLTVIGYGNHETGIIKNIETDPLQRFVDLLRSTTNSSFFAGGYGGWLVVQQELDNGSSSKNAKRTTTKIKYFHGSGGGGIVTKGAINLTRALEMYGDFDVFCLGHIHENSSRNDVREILGFNRFDGYHSKQKIIHNMITGTYKEEYEDGFGGWHIQRGAPPKMVGGRILTISIKCENNKLKKFISSSEFNL